MKINKKAASAIWLACAVIWIACAVVQIMSEKKIIGILNIVVACLCLVNFVIALKSSKERKED